MSTTILDRIVATKRDEIAQQRGGADGAGAPDRCRPAGPRLPRGAGCRAGVQVIAEVKKASAASAGVILRPTSTRSPSPRTYAAAGAAGISVLTDAPYFQGHLRSPGRIRPPPSRTAVAQGFHSRSLSGAGGARRQRDAVLLIAEILPGDALAAALADIRGLGMEAAGRAVRRRQPAARARRRRAPGRGEQPRPARSPCAGAPSTWRRMPPGVLLVSESGIRDRADVDRLRAAGVKAILVGETLMRARRRGRHAPRPAR
ncbi:MAG: hypothetical protein U0736_00175 [Gemmataceae bacterium]